MLVQIWYMKPEWFHNGILGVEVMKLTGRMPDRDDLTKTHVLLKELDARSLDAAWRAMQGENWSYGDAQAEAQALIESKGLSHTSMCVGDIIVDDQGVAHIVDNMGWSQLERGAVT